MWHNFSKVRNGAASNAAPLSIRGIILRNNYQGIQFTQELTGVVDTAASRSVIPLQVALSMQLPSTGKIDGLKSFDRRIQLNSYSTFNAEMFIPQWGWMMLSVIACERDDILLGRDICDKKLLMVNWRSCGFGMRDARTWHRPLELVFKRLKKKKMFEN